MASEVQFEKALEKLEKIVQDLETGEISLDEALKKYEEGVKLSRACQNKLEQAEKRIEVLVKNADGSFSKKDFEPEEGDGSQHGKSSKTKKTSRAAKKEIAVDDEDLLI